MTDIEIRNLQRKAALSCDAEDLKALKRAVERRGLHPENYINIMAACNYLPYNRQDIINAVARYLFAFGYSDWAEQTGRDELHPGAGGDWMNVLPKTPKEFLLEAEKFIAEFEKIHGHSIESLIPQDKELEPDDIDEEILNNFCYGLVGQSLGHGVEGIELEHGHRDSSVDIEICEDLFGDGTYGYSIRFRLYDVTDRGDNTIHLIEEREESRRAESAKDLVAEITKELQEWVNSFSWDISDPIEIRAEADIENAGEGGPDESEAISIEAVIKPEED